jgi:hypothetical protein
MTDNASAPATDDAPAPITLQDFVEAEQELHNLIGNLLFGFAAKYSQLPIEYKIKLVEDGDDSFHYEGLFTLESLPELPQQ